LEHQQKLISELKKKAIEIRKRVIEMVAEAGIGHIGSDLSSIDILTVLYFHILKIDPQRPGWEDRDRFVLSKGHGCGALYTTLAKAGFFSEELLNTFMELDTNLPGHPDRNKTPGIEMNTGALGHGLPVSIGMALAGKIDRRSYRVFVLMGDGEQDEGSVWEGAMAASHFKLDSLAAIIDRNGLQLGGSTEDTMSLEPLDDKYRSFGWAVKIINGNDVEELMDTLSDLPFNKGKPSLIIARTVKGKGVSFIENRPEWHHRVPTEEEKLLAVRELGSVQ
jgi:transketolase